MIPNKLLTDTIQQNIKRITHQDQLEIAPQMQVFKKYPTM